MNESIAGGVTDEVVELAKGAAMAIHHCKEPWFPMTDRRMRAALLAVWPVDAMNIGVRGVSCGDCPRDYDRAPETSRRKAAVELVLNLGWEWDGKAWIPPLREGSLSSWASVCGNSNQIHNDTISPRK